MEMKIDKAKFVAAVQAPDGGGSELTFARHPAYIIVQEGNFLHIRAGNKSNGETIEVPMANVACLKRAVTLAEPAKK